MNLHTLAPARLQLYVEFASQRWPRFQWRIGPMIDRLYYTDPNMPNPRPYEYRLAALNTEYGPEYRTWLARRTSA